MRANPHEVVWSVLCRQNWLLGSDFNGEISCILSQPALMSKVCFNLQQVTCFVLN